MSRNYRDSGVGEGSAPPPGPPPPIMPEGWIAKFDERYQQFYYVNIATKQSQWDKPPGTIDSPARAPDESERLSSYNDKPAPSVYNRDDTTVRPITPQQQFQPQSQYLQTTQPALPASRSPFRSLAGSLSSFFKSRSRKPTKQQQYYAPQSYYQQQGRPPYGDPGYMQAPPRRSGMGVGGAAALGAGGGLLGGMMLADVCDDHNGHEQGFGDGADSDGGYDGGDMGDSGGGDFGGGDFGGGDFGGGDFGGGDC